MRFTPIDYMFSDRLRIVRAIDEDDDEMVHIYVPSIGFVRKTEGNFIYDIKTITPNSISDVIDIIKGLNDDDMHTTQYETICNIMNIICKAFNPNTTDDLEYNGDDTFGVGVYNTDIAKLFKNDRNDGLTIVSIILDFYIDRNGPFDRLFLDECAASNLKHTKCSDILHEHIIDILLDYYTALDYIKDVFSKIGVKGDIESIIDSRIIEFLDSLHEDYHVLSLDNEEELKAKAFEESKEFMNDVYFEYEAIHERFNHVQVFEKMLKDGRPLNEFSQDDSDKKESPKSKSRPKKKSKTKESHKDTNSPTVIDLVNSIVNSYE